MQTLLLLRHAKAEPEDGSDHARALTDRGEADAREVGLRIAARGIVPRVVVSSTAARAHRTAVLAAETSGFGGTIEYRDDLYLAPPGAYIDVLRGLAEATTSPVLLVGHNPGIESLVSLLIGTERTLQTATLAHLEVDWPAWGAARLSGDARLVDLWRP